MIQASSQQALAQGMTFDRALALIARAGVTVPVIVFSYLNPLLAAGPDALAAPPTPGASGVLVTDLPVGADPAREAWLGESHLAFIRLVAPTTPSDRMSEIARHGSGFVYLISRLGVTGARAELPPELPATVARLRAATDASHLRGIRHRAAGACRVGRAGGRWCGGRQCAGRGGGPQRGRRRSRLPVAFAADSMRRSLIARASAPGRLDRVSDFLHRYTRALGVVGFGGAHRRPHSPTTGG